LLAPITSRVRCAYPGYAVVILLHSRCAQWLEKTVDKCVQALACNAFKSVANFSPMHPNASSRPFCRSGQLLHSRCAQSMEKPVDKPAQPLRDKGFKNVVKI